MSPSRQISGLGFLALGLLVAAPLSTMHCGTSTPSYVALNNTDPVANAGVDALGTVGTAIQLDGGRSYDPDGDELSFHWNLATRPTDSALGDAPFTSNGDRNAAQTTLIPDVPGLYVFGLVVEDTYEVRSDRDFVVVEVAPGGTRPVANAGENQQALEGASSCLDGGESFDPLDRGLTYQWQLLTAPDSSTLDGSSLTLDQQELCFTPDAPGSFTFSLVVEAEGIDSEPDFVFVAVGSTNVGPTARVEVVQAASCGMVVVDGSASTDPEGDALRYSWDLLLAPNTSDLPLGPEAFDDASAAQARFYADVPGSYALQLVVDDGEDYSPPIFVELDLEPKVENQPPVLAHSGDGYVSHPGGTCSVDAYGNCSACPNCPGVVIPLDVDGTIDPDGDSLEIEWRLAGGTATLAEETGWTNELTVSGPPSSCTGGVTTNTVEVVVRARDCSGAVDESTITVIYECGN